MNTKFKQTTSAADLFHSVEHAILADYLGKARPACAKDIDPYAEKELQLEDDETGVVRVRKNLWGDVGQFALENAVARLVLNSIQYRLPQWAAVNSQGEVQLARDINKRRKEGISLLPQYLFEINWADSGPGFSWPEKYFATFVPGYERYIVTASADCPDAYGYEDLAIGHYSQDTPLDEGCRDALINWWLEWTGGESERRWQYFWDAGLIDQNAASRWALSVWGPTDDDLMGADMALGFWEQNGADVTRESLIEYAIKKDIVWALEFFLDRRGWLDDDWEERLPGLEEVQS